METGAIPYILLPVALIQAFFMMMMDASGFQMRFGIIVPAEHIFGEYSWTPPSTIDFELVSLMFE